MASAKETRIAELRALVEELGLPGDVDRLIEGGLRFIKQIEESDRFKLVPGEYLGIDVGAGKRKLDISIELRKFGITEELETLLREIDITESLSSDEITLRRGSDTERGIVTEDSELSEAVLIQLLDIGNRTGIVELFEEAGIDEDALPAFLEERSDFANDIRRKMFEVRGADYGDDPVLMIESAEFQDVLNASIQSIVLYEIANNEGYSARTRELAETNRKVIGDEARLQPTGTVFNEVVGASTNANWLAGLDLGAPTYEMAGSEWFAIEDRILELTGRVPDERLETRLAKELREAESTDPMGYFTTNWEPTIGEYVAAYDRIDTTGYDGTLTPLVEKWLDSNITGQLRRDLRDNLKGKLLQHFNTTGIQNKQDLYKDFLNITEETPSGDDSGFRTAINDYMAIMVGDDGITAGLTANGMTYEKLLNIIPEGTLLNTPEEIVDYVYGWTESWNVSEAGQANPIVPTSTREDSNTLIRSELIKALGAGTFANIPNSMYGAIFEKIEGELIAASNAGGIVQDSAGIRSFINKNASKFVADSLRQQVLTVEGGELLIQAWESMGVQAMDGLVNMVSEGNLDGDSYLFDGAVAEQLSNAAPFSLRQAQVQASLSNAGLDLLPVGDRGVATQSAVTYFNNLFSRYDFVNAYDNVFDRTNAVLDSNEFKSQLPTYVDQSLEDLMGESALVSGMIDLYGSARNVVEASGIDPTNMTSGEYIESLEDFGISLSTVILDQTHTPESVAKFSNLRDSFQNSQGDATVLQKYIRDSVITFAENQGITDADELGSLISASLEFAARNVGPLRVFQDTDEFIRRSDIQGEIGKIAGEQAFGKLRTEGIRGFIEGQGFDPADVASFSGFAQSLFDQLEATAEEGATPEDILASDEFVQAFAKERQQVDEKVAREAEEETPVARAARERQVAGTAHALLDPQLQEHVSKFLGSTGDIGDPAEVQREFEKYVQEQQAQTSERAQAQSGVGHLATQTTGEAALSFGDFINALDSDQSPTSSADFFQSFLDQRLDSSVLVGKQRQARVNRIRTAAPTGGSQIRNPSLGIGL